MAAIRWRLRLAAFAWMLIQTATLTAFVPMACCEAHRPASGAGHDHHEGAACPMRTADGRPCAMHAHQTSDHGEDHGSAAGSEETGWAVTAACEGPSAALASLFSYSATPAPAVSFMPPFGPDPATVVYRAVPVRTSTPPDSPPPRA